MKINIMPNVILCEKQPTGLYKIQIFPNGKFKSQDGRPEDGGFWEMNQDTAEEIIKDFNENCGDMVLDYEHQSILSIENGQPAPAAGWFKSLEFNSDGMFGIVELTSKAASFVDNLEYRFISPVFLTGPNNKIEKLLGAALTNTPALKKMSSITALSSGFKNNETNEICLLLGLDHNSTNDQIIQSINNLKLDNKKIQVEALVDSAIHSGKIPSKAKTLCMSLGMNTSDLESLKKLLFMLDHRPDLSRQSQSILNQEQISQNDLMICKSLGIKPTNLSEVK